MLTLPAGEWARWEIDGTPFEAAGALALRAPPGEHAIVAFDARGRRHEGRITLAEEGTALSEVDLTRPPPPQGHLPPEVIQGVVRPRVARLRQCYERTLRRTQPELEGSFALRVTVGRDGRVSRVRLRTDVDAPRPFVGCLEREAQRWEFPPPEGHAPMTFELPLGFTAASAR